MHDPTKKHIELAGTVTVGPKGQVVIPADVRENMGIKPGDKLVALYMSGKNSVCFIPESSLQDLIDKMGEHLEQVRSIVKKK